jgi:CDP-glycerol glycerophosphotransferase
MAKFTFGGGNARALLRAPLYVAGSLLAHVVPRDANLWVFGSGFGPADGARALYAAAARMPGRRRLVWLCTDRAELRRARELDMPAARKGSWQGFLLTLRAQVVVVTHGSGDVNRYGTGGAVLVQLWHGIPLKKLHLDSPATLRLGSLPDHPLVRAALSALYRHAGRRISLVPAASVVSAARLRTAFGLPQHVLAVTGDPRNDGLLAGTGAEPRERGRAAMERVVGPLPPTVVLYAPTWRDGQPDPGIPSDAEWKAIDDWLEATESMLLVRPHPLARGSYADGPERSSRVRVVDAASLADVMPVLPAVDVLITDYSSIAYDYALTGGPVVFFAPDLEEYEASRGLYEPYDEFSGGTHVRDWSGVIRLATGATRDHRLLEQSRRLRDEHFDFLDAGASDRVLAEILSRVGPPSEERVPRASGGRADHLRITSLEVDARPSLRVAGPAGDLVPQAARLVGTRLTLVGEVSVSAAGWVVTIPLVSRPWGGPELAPPSGTYRLELDTSVGTTSRVEVQPSLPPETLTSLFRLALAADEGTLDATFGPPLLDSELGRRNQRRLERHYRRRPAPPRAAVFFESFYGATVACNPRAIDAEIARVRPDIERLWSTRDVSVGVPEGAVRILEGSAAWWDARGAAKLLVVNDWLRKRYRRQPHQRVLQTWHGTMLKRLALDRRGRSLRPRVAVLRERRRWDVMLSQNPHSTRTFQSAYRFHGPIWEEGYPRDDSLVQGDHGKEVRERLGLAEGAFVVLYAPTWRDDGSVVLNEDGLSFLAAGLGGEVMLLVRQHSRALAHGSHVHGHRVLDVTTYPDVSDLLLVADVLVTDYSSVMFDFSATGKPIVFYTPDLERYGDELRGFYFDLLSEAPGPVCSTVPELVAAIAGAGSSGDTYADRYASWQQRFNPHDDGRAAHRIVQRILQSGLLG